MKVTLISKQDTEERQGTTPIRGAYGKIVDIPYVPTLIIASPAHVPYLRQMGTIVKDGLKGICYFYTLVTDAFFKFKTEDPRSRSLLPYRLLRLQKA